MSQIITLQAKLFSEDGVVPERMPEYGGDWLRSVIIKVVERFRPKLEQQRIDCSLFHNHNESTGKTLIRYPLIIYHQIGQEFLITGIDAGAEALRILASVVRDFVPIDAHLVLRINRISDVAIDIGLTDNRIHYSLYNWLPLSQADMKEYSESPLTGKVAILERKLRNHIEDDFARFLNLPLKGVQVLIEDLIHFDTHRQQYKNHLYMAFSLVFSANAQLPDLMTLGNGKAYGFGRVERL